MTHDKKTKEFLLVVLKIFYDKEYLLVQEFIVLCSSFTITDTSFKPFLAAARQLEKNMLVRNDMDEMNIRDVRDYLALHLEIN